MVRKHRKRKATPEQRVRAWMNPKYTGEVLYIDAHGSRYGMREFPGKLSRCMRDGKPYEQPLLEYIHSLSLQGTAVDAGANVGNHTMWFAAICSLEVVAFEPLRYRELAANASLNGLYPDGPVQIHPVALGSSLGSADIRVEEHPKVGQLRAGSLKPGNRIPVKPLDDYALKDVVLIKVDVEGWEGLVLEGARQTIQDYQPLIFAEQWDEAAHNAIKDVLSPLGYRMTRTFSSGESKSPVGCWEPS